MARFDGTSGDDTINGSDENDLLVGGNGNDSLFGGAGNDGFYGGGGADSIYGEAGNDTLFGDGGDDSLFGGDGDDKLFGGNHNDTLVGGAGNNIAKGGTGNDRLLHTLGVGVDTFDGESGLDTVELIITSDQITPEIMSALTDLNTWLQAELATAGGDPLALATAPTGNSYTNQTLGLTLTSVEDIRVSIDGILSSLADYLGYTGDGNTSGSNAPAGFDYGIYGTVDVDQLTGTEFADYIEAYEGDDYIETLDGLDEVHGGAGNDTIIGGQQRDVIYGDDGNDLIIGDHGEDELYGGAGDDIMFGGGLADIIFGGEGNDTLYGDGNADTLDGGEGDNVLFGGDGNDTLIHNVGATNAIDGGVGMDNLILNLTSASLTAAVKDDLAALKDWLDAGQTDSRIVLAELDLIVTSVENVVVNIDGQEVSLEEAANRAPTTVAEVSLTGDEDTDITGSVDASDPDGQPLTYSVAVGPQNGAVSVDPNTGVYVYTPNAHFSGADVFELMVTDPFGETVTQTVNISVTAVADAPIVQNATTLNLVGQVAPAPVQGTNGRETLNGDQAVPQDQTIALPLSIQLADLDGSETLSVTVSGLPEGYSLSAGTENADGSVTLAASDLDDLMLDIPGSSTNVTFTLQVAAVASEQNGSTAQTTTSVTVNIDNGAILDDTIYGMDGNDRLNGGDGNDILIGGAGNDRVNGGAGDDVIVAGAGNDRYDGDGGFDTVDYSQVNGSVTIRLDLEAASGAGGSDRFDNIEGAIGTDFADFIYDSTVDNIIDAGAGDDVIYSGLGGSNTLTGGAGADTFIMDASKTTSDVITDFDASEDIINLTFRDTSGGVVVTEQDGNTVVGALNAANEYSEYFTLEGVTGLNGSDWYVV